MVGCRLIHIYIINIVISDAQLDTRAELNAHVGCVLIYYRWTYIYIYVVSAFLTLDRTWERVLGAGRALYVM